MRKTGALGGVLVTAAQLSQDVHNSHAPSRGKPISWGSSKQGFQGGGELPGTVFLLFEVTFVTEGGGWGPDL